MPAVRPAHASNTQGRIQRAQAGVNLTGETKAATAKEKAVEKPDIAEV